MVKRSAQIDELFKKFIALRQEIVEVLRADPQRINDTSYDLRDGTVAVSLGQLFSGGRDLIVIHNMGKSCAYCTLWADGLNGLLAHIKSRTSVVLVNRDTPEVQREFAHSRQWQFRMIHDADGTFTQEMGFAEQGAHGLSLWPGYSTFHMDDNGEITRVGYDAFGPGDMYMPLFPMFELLKDGVSTWQPQYSYHSPLTITLPEGL